MTIRPCTQADLDALLSLFLCRSPHRLRRRLYPCPALRPGAGGPRFRPLGGKLRQETFLTAEEDGPLLGFGAIEGTYLTCSTFVRTARAGIGTVLCDFLEQQCTGPVLTVHASRTARPLEARAIA